jgi:coenzyme F420 biosynthesis associated uncharacterized protein
MSESLVDWGLAERVSQRVSSAADADARPHDPVLEPRSLALTCAEAERLVRSFASLDPAGELPAPERVGRAEWSRTVLATLRAMADELQRRHEISVSLPGPLGSIARSVVGAATGTEVGVAAGYAARRVLGQYDLSIVGPERAPRLLFVAPNIRSAADELEVELEPFVRWVALHETTHAIQFAAAPWLQGHLSDQIQTLLGSAASGVGFTDVIKRIAHDPRGALGAFLRGDVAKALAGPEHAPTLDRIQALMTVVEGHAEHVMDGAAGEFVTDVATLRAKLERRRASRGPLETIFSRLLGMDLKLRQYELGKSFCDEVAAAGGTEALNRVWEGPEALPTTEELRRPDEWLRRSAALYGPAATPL